MKTGRTAPEFLAEIERQNAAKRDFIAPANQLAVLEDNRIGLTDLAYGMNDNFQSQAATWLNYPVDFWRRSRDQYPDQWRGMVNAMLASKPDPRLVRTIDGNARAFLSDRYRRIDNADVAATALKAVFDMRGWVVAAAEITESNMYLKVLTPLIKDVSVGNPVQAGFMIRNSEIGLGSFVVSRFTYFLSCTNGAITEGGIKRSHLGASISGGDSEARELFSDDTKRLTDAALMAQTSDVIRAAANEAEFSLLVDKLRATQDRRIEADVPAVIEVTAKKYGLNETESNAVLRNLIEGASLSQWGLFNAVTLAAHQDEHMPFERSIELEHVGGTIANLDGKAWIDIAAKK